MKLEGRGVVGHEVEPLIVQELPKDCVLLDDRRDPGRGGIMYDSKNITEGTYVAKSASQLATALQFEFLLNFHFGRVSILPVLLVWHRSIEEFLHEVFQIRQGNRLTV